jgi:ribosomal protein S18 acetylase RimI-like enzyme
MNIEVTKLGRSQFDLATEVLANAFQTDPIFRYLLPKPDRARANDIKAMFKLALNYCQPYNHIYTTANDLKGIAIWIPPKHSYLNLLRLVPLAITLPFQLGWSSLWQILILFSRAEEHRLRYMPQPHWYLAGLGVSTDCQGQGIGGLLLQPILKQADSENVPCYLETSTEGGVRFYQRHGFGVITKTQLLENAPPMWMMKRDPS